MRSIFDILRDGAPTGPVHTGGSAQTVRGRAIQHALRRLQTVSTDSDDASSVAASDADIPAKVSCLEDKAMDADQPQLPSLRDTPVSRLPLVIPAPTRTAHMRNEQKQEEEHLELLRSVRCHRKQACIYSGTGGGALCMWAKPRICAHV